MVCFKVLSQNLCRGMNKNHENLRIASSWAQIKIPVGLRKCEASVLTLQPQHLVHILRSNISSSFLHRQEPFGSYFKFVDTVCVVNMRFEGNYRRLHLSPLVVNHDIDYIFRILYLLLTFNLVSLIFDILLNAMQFSRCVTPYTQLVFLC
jgi:hypothetical protein